jgi:hypothetical protein
MLNLFEPIAWRGAVAWAADDARPSLHVRKCDFLTREAARHWVEEARAVAKDRSNFACCVTPVFGEPL